MLPADTGAAWGVTAVPPGADLSPLLRGLPPGPAPRDAAAAFAAIASCRASGGMAASGAAAASAAFDGGAPASAAAVPPPWANAATPFSAALAAMRWPSPVAALGTTPAALLSSRQSSLGALLELRNFGAHGGAFDALPPGGPGMPGGSAVADFVCAMAAQQHGHAASTPGSASAERARASA